jgi:hypothetical protein
MARRALPRPAGREAAARDLERFHKWCRPGQRNRQGTTVVPIQVRVRRALAPEGSLLFVLQDRPQRLKPVGERATGGMAEAMP